MMRRIVLGVLLAFTVAVVTQAQSSQDVTRATPYSGRPLSGAVFLCKSGDATTGGFRTAPDGERVLQIAEITRQPNVTTWRVTIRRDDAEVIAFGGATQTLDAPEVFSLRRSPDAIALFRQEGLNSQTMTIDLANSSFVYSGHSINILMNRANVFAGSCQPYV